MKGGCRIDLVVGTRPNIIKLAPLFHVLSAQDWCQVRIVFIGQHTSPNLSDDVFEDLGIGPGATLRVPLVRVGYGERLGEIVAGYASVLSASGPDVVVVFGDVDVTLGAALAAKRGGFPLVHIEAGLRSGDMGMPEEMNRILVDSIADVFYASSEDASNNLIFGEAKDPKCVHFVGNIMIDSLVRAASEEVKNHIALRLGLSRGDFSIATFHRPSNVDEPQALAEVVELLEYLASRSPLVLPLHPRTETALVRNGLRQRIADNARIIDVEALRYREFINLLGMSPRMVLTDSGGVQEEASYLGVPCLTYRENTERPVTVRIGTNVLVNRYDVRSVIDSILSGARDVGVIAGRIPLWDGNTAHRIAASLHVWWRTGAARK